MIRALIITAACVAACKAEPAATNVDEDVPRAKYQTSPPMPSEPPETEYDRMTRALSRSSTLRDALQVAAPAMRDVVDGSSIGSLLLAGWASERLALSDVDVRQDESTIKLAKKDPDAARGKRLCVRARIIQITKSNMGTKVPVFVGQLMTGEYDVVYFIAARSTGDLVEGSPARFCGVVTGTHSYSNVSGGQTHAVEMIGVFDLPENRSANDGTDSAAGIDQRSRPQVRTSDVEPVDDREIVEMPVPTWLRSEPASPAGGKEQEPKVEGDTIGRDGGGATVGAREATVAGFVARVLTEMDAATADICQCATYACAKEIAGNLGSRGFRAGFEYTSSRVPSNELNLFMSEMQQEPEALTAFIKSRHAAWWAKFKLRFDGCVARLKGR